MTGRPISEARALTYPWRDHRSMAEVIAGATVAVTETEFESHLFREVDAGLRVPLIYCDNDEERP
jgi:hypothetical protein